MISQEAIQTILGIKEKVHIEPSEMADKLNITFYPFDPEKASAEVQVFQKKIEDTFTELKVNIVPYEKSLERVSISWRIIRINKIFLNNFLYSIAKLFRKETLYNFIPWSSIRNTLQNKRIKRGISVVVTGECDADNLPMLKTSSFRESSIITILDFPKNINANSSFQDHFDTALSLFAYNMTNIVIAVNKEKWMVYNFNASHPIYPLDKNFKENVLHALIPKIVAPIRPHRFKDFKISKETFDLYDSFHKDAVEDIVASGSLLEKTGLYPKGKKIDDLPFQSNFFKWIGKIHLDNRNGMSYGFLAHQLPLKLSPVFDLQKVKEDFKDVYNPEKDYFIKDGEIYLVIKISSGEVCIKVPPVWVLTQRSGSDKLNIKPKKDLIKLGLINGEMYLQKPEGSILDNDFKPSFDTKVILAHAIGNALVASIIKNSSELNPLFAKKLETEGLALCHWHGYFHPEKIPENIHYYGLENPHVSCSTSQSAIYALQGKITSFTKSLEKNKDFYGDIHVEPHHGSNITFFSIKELAKFFNDNPLATTLGNKYLELYK